ncbi:branched-chain amino acid ABC transporter permease [Halogeometricum luteum]|uniref:Branched-chain amino acid ABC transporter permease n=1 Tax=Halogeometricum luteum TaxID=2950537 RepID=A0ABU2G3Y9_9EURY|nr:branched-chain amino acid ABC transporter permease [Halogeometricum sp. S3BR5-2]MDS0295512.1 branched-chain amino acid ABC transporter permease [Halogeometricum sp. S3BR5-2]
MSARPSLGAEARNVAVVAALFAVAPLAVLGSSYYESVLAHLLLIALFAVALNIVFGHTDQLFLFVGGLAGVGAYGTALLADALSVSAWVTLPVAALVCGLIGLLVSYVSAKRKFTVVLISILTLNLQLVFSEVFVGARDLTGGSTGFPYEYFELGVVAEAIGVEEKLVLYYLVLLLLVATLGVYLRLVHSKYGVAFDAIREDEIAAESIGIDVVRYKTIAGFVAAFLIGLTGAFFARESGYILPGGFTFLAVDVVVLIVLVVGGLRTTLGPIVGAVIVVGIEEFLSSAQSLQSWQSAIFGALLIVLFLYFRRGVVRSVRDALDDAGLTGDREGGGTDAEADGGR